MRSRCAYISRNFHVVSTWSSGKGKGPGAKAFCARRSITELSFPIEYIITGFSNSETASRRMWMLSASSCRRCVNLLASIGRVTAWPRPCAG